MRFRHQHQHRDVLERLALPDITSINGQIMSIFVVTESASSTRISRVTATDDSNAASSPTANSSSSNGRQIGAPVQASTDSSSATSDSSSSPTTQADQPTVSSTAVATLQRPTRTTTTTDVTTTSQEVAATIAATTPSTSSITTTSIPTTSSSTSRSSTRTANANAASTSTVSSSDTTSGGMSTGGKVGLAIGIIALLAAIAGIVFFVVARKRKRDEHQAGAYDEKTDYDNRPAAPLVASKTNAPRLSLRPMSRLVPDMLGGAGNKNRSSQGNMLATLSDQTGRHLTPSEVPAPVNAPRENPFQDPANPFADPEKAARAAAAAAATGAGMPPSQQNATAPLRGPGPEAAATNQSAPTPAMAAAGPVPETPAGNVYRILMDFRPTMEDELELHAGQLVRLLHEYDDGWALCIRLDRSQQGVVPRTCLAGKPSKPRPAPGQQPRGPGQPGGPPNGRMSPATNRPQSPRGPSPAMNRPMSPRGPSPGTNRPMTPVTGRSRPTTPASPSQGSPTTRPLSPGGFNQAPRPLSPGPRPASQKRSLSPGPSKAVPMVAQRRRSNSATASGQLARRNSPPNPSRLGPGPSPTPRSGTPGVAY